MRTLIAIAIAIAFLSGCMGCSQVQQVIQQGTTIDLQNAEASRDMAKKLLSTWRLNSGFIRGALGPKISELPNQAIEAMKELDALAAKENPDDYDLGYSLGARVRMLSTIIQETFKLYAPEVLKYVPGVLGL